MSKAEPPIVELPKPKLAETLINVAHHPTFPFIVLELGKTTKAQSMVSKIRVGPSLYQLLTKLYGTDRLVVYCELPGGHIEAWTADMLMSLRILSRLEIMSPPEQWIAKTKEYIATQLSGEKPTQSAIPPPDEKALNIAGEILDAAKLLPEVKAKTNLVAVARDVILSRTKDSDSIIYRLAMAVYHSKRIAGEPAVAGLEDPAEAYLALTQHTEFCKKYPSIIEEINERPSPLRHEAVKTLMSFTIAAYVYNRALQTL